MNEEINAFLKGRPIEFRILAKHLCEKSIQKYPNECRFCFENEITIKCVECNVEYCDMCYNTRKDHIDLLPFKRMESPIDEFGYSHEYATCYWGCSDRERFNHKMICKSVYKTHVCKKCSKEFIDPFEFLQSNHIFNINDTVVAHKLYQFKDLTCVHCLHKQ